MKKGFFGKLFLAMIILSCLSSSVLAQGLANIVPCRDGDQRPCGAGLENARKARQPVRAVSGGCVRMVLPQLMRHVMTGLTMTATVLLMTADSIQYP